MGAENIRQPISDFRENPHITPPRGDSLDSSHTAFGLPTVAKNTMAPLVTEASRANAQERFDVRTYKGDPASVNEFLPEVFDLHSRVFRPIYEASAKIHGEETDQLLGDDNHDLMEIVEFDRTVFVSLRERESGALVGYTYAHPSTIRQDAREDFEGHGSIEGFDSWEEYEAMIAASVETGYTSIAPEYRGQGGWSLMMDALHSQLEEDKKVKYVRRFVRTEGSYDEKIRANARGEVVYESDKIDLYLGPQKYYRIRLPRDTDKGQE